MSQDIWTENVNALPGWMSSNMYDLASLLLTVFIIYLWYMYSFINKHLAGGSIAVPRFP